MKDNKKELLNIIKMLEVYSKVEYRFKEGGLTEEEAKEQKEINRNINKMAVLNASSENGLKSAFETFKRC